MSDMQLFSSHNGDVYWGMVCRGHVDLAEFEAECRRDSDNIIDKKLKPEHCWLVWKGFGGYEYCQPDAKGARPWTVWPSWEGPQGYSEWLADNPGGGDTDNLENPREI